MKPIQEELQELSVLLQNGQEVAYQKKFDCIQENYTSEADRAAIAEFIMNGYRQLETEAEEIETLLANQERIREMKDIVPLSYIARHYFGKSAAWLQQRLYGYKVRGQVYRLSEEDKQKFNFALQDISRKLGSLSIS